MPPSWKTLLRPAQLWKSLKDTFAAWSVFVDPVIKTIEVGNGIGFRPKADASVDQSVIRAMPLANVNDLFVARHELPQIVEGMQDELADPREVHTPPYLGRPAFGEGQR